MKVTISVGGKFYALQLAEQLAARGCLGHVITSYPRWAFRSEKIDPARIVTFPAAEAVGRGVNLLTKSDAGDYWKALLLDWFVSTRVPDGDLFWGFASFCLYTMQRKKGRCPLLLERACTHILDQTSQLSEEAHRLGLRYRADQRMIDRMVAEYELSDAIVVPSRYSQKSFLDRGFSSDRVPIAALSGKFPPPAVCPSRENQTIFRLLHLGGSFLRKGLIYLLRAWSGLRLKDAQLIIKKPQVVTPEIRRMLKDPTIQVIGYQTNLEAVYSQASAFCLPSIDEGFGMVVLEAMSYGLPVLVTENVGAVDCIRDGVDGFVVRPRDVDGIREKILVLYEDKQRRQRMGEEARKRALEFTWDRYGERVVQIISEFQCGAGSESH